ncbi:MAG TPA: hypothetical protein PLB41_12555, partial [Rubrivivax sp.]|nr:hypothetical protein [Rubrivivax sp.]
MPPRSLLIDALKLLASQLIVLHHIVLYAPMAALVAPSRPALAGLLANEARWAVQIFLVIGGFLCAQALSLYRPSLPQLPRALLGRWLRLVPVLAVALVWQLRTQRYTPWIYWLTVVLVSVVGTQITDVLTDKLGVSLYV